MYNLIKLFALNKSNEGRKFEIVNAVDEATIYLYDAIVSDELTAEWWGGVSPQAFVKELNAITAPIVHLRINCPGGDVFAGRVIENSIRQHKAKFIAHVDGYAASAASYVALACDQVEIAKGGFFMIHKAWSMAYGNSDDMIKTAGLLEKIDNSLVGTYVDETGQTEAQIKSWMTDETWFNAEEAVKYGFADSIADVKVKNSAWDLSAYTKAPDVEEEQETALEIIAKDEEVDNFIDNEHRERQLQRIKLASHNLIG
jgi:ATP-dependent Clp protease, protease subunit